MLTGQRNNIFRSDIQITIYQLQQLTLQTKHIAAVVVYNTHYLHNVKIQTYIVLICPPFNKAEHSFHFLKAPSMKSFHPVLAVHASIAHSLGNVLTLDVLGVVEVGNGTCHLHDAVVGTC